ncbi:MAG: DUF2007 domain-containing protein [Candidatus Nealsonbacteria bacterium]|nr:DUF2007 domain-containing protein [Candidatus Nealsonbacteria bacterium]
MVKLQFFNSVAEAELASNLLKEQGIKNMIQKRYIDVLRADGDGADLFVAVADFEKAKEILEIR